MTKLRHIKAEAFRGARFELPIDFGKDHKSVAIYGENAAGKSTVTDALEWFIHDRVEHLWREDCKQEALRHVLAAEGDDCRVTVRFGGKDQEGSKSLSAELKTVTTFADDDTRELVNNLKDDRIILRHADIVKFLDESKGKKREAIARIIGYEEITDFRSAIQQTRNALQKESAYTSAKQHSEHLQSDMVRLIGQIVPNRAAFLTTAKDLVAPFALKTGISDDNTFATAVEELRGLGNSAEKIKAAERLAQLSRSCDDLKTDIDHLVKGAATFHDSYNTLINERESVNKLRLSDFLSKGRTVIVEGAYADDACPFCLSPYSLTKLQAEIETRLSSMAELQAKLEATKALKDALIETVRVVGTKAKSLGETYKDIEGFAPLIESATVATQFLRDYYKNLGAAFNAFEPFETPKDFDRAIEGMRQHSEMACKQAHEAAKKLNLTELEKRVAEALNKVQALATYVTDYENAQRIIDAYEAQILTLSTIFDRFVEVQNTALQAVLDTISDDVGQFYRRLHPKESVDNVRLAMIGEEGVEFEYSFHGKPSQPPRKYLSESHLNSLGVVLFLANARIFNKHSRFIVLDDIVTSFDTHHRRRLLRLLRDEFANWQIIILTHENIWFDLIKKEMAQSGWLFREVRSDENNGILFDDSPATLKAIIERKRGKEDVTNDLRKLLEAVLKDICYALEVKVAFRFNDVNEKRMPDELLSSLRSALKDKSPDLAKNGVFSDLAGSTLIANLDSHDNPEKVTGGDIDVLLEDIEKLASLFFCASCNRPIQADITVPGSKEISCKCGKSKIAWKS